jgi:glycosyltransferase involved in cell wall biosynthesis
MLHDYEQLKLKPNVSFVANTADSEPYFLAADSFVLTSRDDPFPCVIHEAMACAVPIVAFAGAGGASEALVDSCGILVPYLSVEAMAEAVTFILQYPDNFLAMGKKAEERVRSVYTFSNYAERIFEICEERSTGASGFSTARPTQPSSRIHECTEASRAAE